MATVTRTTGTTCPTCSAVTIPIIWGMPADPELFEQAERGEVELGGCVLGFDNPDRVCRGPVPHYWRDDGDGALIAVVDDRA